MYGGPTMIYLVGLMESCYFCVLIYKSGDKMKQAVWLAAVLILLLPLGRIHSKERYVAYYEL